MSSLQTLLDEIQQLENRLTQEFTEQARKFGYSMQRGHATFEQDIVRQHKAAMRRLRTYFADSSLRNLATAPLVYSLIIPIALLDAWVSLYQAICFRMYEIPRVPRRDFMAFDRQRLAYLNVIERSHCMYCSYANGVIAYVREVAARTEQYWCPIRHAARVRGPHGRYHKFLAYGDAEAYRQEVEKVRCDFRDIP